MLIWKEQFDMSLNGVFNPLTYSLYALTGHPRTKFLNPLTKLIRAEREKLYIMYKYEHAYSYKSNMLLYL